MNKKALKKAIITCFVAVPLLSSIISTLHLVDLFALGNPMWLAIALAVTIEIGSVASFLTLSILSRVNRTIVWTMFVILFFMQIVGNMYFSYEWVTAQMAGKATWIDSFKEMTEFFTGELEMVNVKMYLTILISWPIPLISVFLLKSAVDYIGTDKKEATEEITETLPVEEKDVQPKPVSETFSKEQEEFFNMSAEDREAYRRRIAEEQEAFFNMSPEEQELYRKRVEEQK